MLVVALRSFTQLVADPFVLPEVAIDVQVVAAVVAAVITFGLLWWLRERRHG